MEGKMNSKSQQQIQWVKGTPIGSGSFGVVNLAMNRSNGEIFVVKSGGGAGFQSLQNEAEILKSLDSPYIVRCLGHEISGEPNGERQFNLFMEFMAGGSLSDLSKKFGGSGLDESVIRSYTRDILHGLAYLHGKGIVHCDLKCKNVLMGASGNVKLADFGAARKMNSPKSDMNSKNFWQSMCGTPLWMAPEVLRSEGLSPASDMWSLGCTVIEMATGKLPWGEDISNPMAAVYKITCSNETPQFPSEFSKQGMDFLSKCLERDPRKRWTSEELLSHPFISGNLNSMDLCTPTSVLDVRGWESDGSESPERGELLSRIPFSKRCCNNDVESLFGSSDNWLEVRS
ncbi:hypothetical protein AAC387_Pa04g2440 [Persea americana]